MTEIKEKITLGLVVRRWVTPSATRPADLPHLASGKDVQRYTTAALVGGVPCLAAATYYFGLQMVAMAAVALLGATLVELAFRFEKTSSPQGIKFRQTGTFTGGQLAYAVLFALTLPPGTSLGLVLLASVMGVLFAQEVFGGAGRNVFNVVLVSKALLLFSYLPMDLAPSFGSMMSFADSKWSMIQSCDSAYIVFGQVCTIDPWMVCTALLGIGALAMIVAKVSNLAVMLSCAAAMAVGVSIANEAGMLPKDTFANPNQLLAFHGMALGVCLLICDPGTMPASLVGKVIYGLLIGSCAILMRTMSSYNESMVGAVLMGNLAAPLLDSMFVKTPKEEPAPIRPVCAECGEA